LVRPDEWDSENKIIKGNPQTNSKLQEVIGKVQKELLMAEYENVPHTATQLKERITGEAQKKEHITLQSYMNGTFLVRFAQLVKVGKNKPSTLRKYKQLVKSIEGYLAHNKSSKLLLTQASVKHAKDMIHFLEVEKKLDVNEAKLRVKLLKRILNEAVADELIERNPLANYKLDIKTKSVKTYLTESELQMLIDFVFASPTLSRARDWFVFLCETGFYYSDLKAFNAETHLKKVGNQLVISTNRVKSSTENQLPTIIPISDTAKAILERHENFTTTKFSCDHHFRRWLRQCALMVGLPAEKLQPKVGSKTFITLWKARGLDMFVLMKASGHKKVQTVMNHYATIEDETVVEQFNKHKIKNEIQPQPNK
jgi:integrase